MVRNTNQYNSRRRQLAILGLLAQLPLYFVFHSWIGFEQASAVAAAVVTVAAWSLVALYAPRRFSLRSFLIVLTVLLVLLATVGMRILSARKQRSAAAQLQAVGVAVHYDDEYDARGLPIGYSTPNDDWMHALLGHDFLNNVVRVDLGNRSYGNKELEYLTRLRKCKHISLESTARITDDTAFRHLCDVPGLETLSSETKSLDDAALSHLVGARSIKALDFGYCPYVTDAGLGHLSHLTQLESLTLGTAQVTDAGLAKLVSLRNLKSLYVGGPGITDAATDSLKRLTKLERLALPQSQIGDSLLEGLAELKELKTLTLIHTANVTDAGLRHLEKQPNLETVILAGTGVTDDGVAAFQKKRPNCQVHLR